MEICTDWLAGRAYFRHLTLKAAFGKYRKSKDFNTKLPFTSHHSLSWFTPMPFHSMKGPGLFQEAMDDQLTKVKWEFATAFSDCIVIFLCMPYKHIDLARWVLMLLFDADLTLNRRIVRFLQMASIFSVMLFAKGTSRFQLEELMPYENTSTQLQ